MCRLVFNTLHCMWYLGGKYASLPRPRSAQLSPILFLQHAPAPTGHALTLWTLRDRSDGSHMASLCTLYVVAAPSAAHLQLALPPAWRSRPARPHPPQPTLPQYTTPLPSAPNTTFFMLVLGATPVERV